MPYLAHGDHVMEVGITHNGVCNVLHGVCCGWGQEFSPDEETWDHPDEVPLEVEA